MVAAAKDGRGDRIALEPRIHCRPRCAWSGALTDRRNFLVRLTRRNALGLAGAAASTLVTGAAIASAEEIKEGAPDVLPGPFTNTRESLRSYVVPEWFADAKFG